ncbi:putative short chain dehydrogenase/reductase [Aspergillus thermomutatus]|uniref:Uncharacterized protein n=1 Tax=Aspergillus thermomutatus TaxID=41047 RepID=A0A397GVX8_ASPTH|nr:uncharacterized protein CDV56_105142 [Aspergillus thermomutatus]RHZ55161.1 hypothetical protein CDV56_105142 [Aspergillus thermomutatus]
MQGYAHKGPIDCTKPINSETIRGKPAIVTGGIIPCKTKWATRGIMHSLRRTAFYYGSRINVISPWYVKTNILSDEAFAHVKSAGDQTINGPSLFVSGRKWAPKGYMDLDLDDYPGNPLIQGIQEDQLKPEHFSLGLFA